MEMQAQEYPILIAQTGPFEGQRWVIDDTLIIGREKDCHIIITSHQVSRHHARFTLTPQGVILEDLGSKNGTYCNGELVTDPVLLKEEDIIQIALAQQFIFLNSDATVPLGNGLRNMGVRSIPTVKYRLHLDKRSRRVWVNEREILPPLSVQQFNLLDILYHHKDQVVSRPQIIQYVWGEEDAIAVSDQALDALVRRLRDRIADLDPSHEYIITVRGHGLRLDNPII